MSNERRVFRTEKKYLISILTAENLFNKLSQLMDGDDTNGYETYMVRSLYFDTPDNNDYHDKIAGLNYRKKIRLRIYDTKKDEAKLEIKEKQGKFQLKRSLNLNKEQAIMIINRDFEFLYDMDSELAKELYAILKSDNYMPVCVVDYRRRALTNFTNDTRITFDSVVSSSECNFDIFDDNLAVVPVMNFDETVLEVKYNGFLLRYIKKILNYIDSSEVSYSKYCMARKYSFGN